MKNTLPLLAVLLGVLLCALSYVWPTLFPATQKWTEEKNERMTELGSEIKRLDFARIQAENNPNMHGGENPAELKAQLTEARTEFDSLKSEFEIARDSPTSSANSMFWLGIASVLGGGLFVFANRGDS